jgi:hypothetical protein
VSNCQLAIAWEADTYVAVAAEATDGADRGISRQVSLFFLLDHQRGGGCFVWILLGSLLLEQSDGRVGGGGVSGLEQHYSQTVSEHLINVAQFTLSEYNITLDMVFSRR